jgi:hypothetical protein
MSYRYNRDSCHATTHYRHAAEKLQREKDNYISSLDATDLPQGTTNEELVLEMRSWLRDDSQGGRGGTSIGGGGGGWGSDGAGGE